MPDDENFIGLGDNIHRRVAPWLQGDKFYFLANQPGKLLIIYMKIRVAGHFTVHVGDFMYEGTIRQQENDGYTADWECKQIGIKGELGHWVADGDKAQADAENEIRLRHKRIY